MDKHVNQVTKRPRVLTLCMLAATVSTLALAGCGNGDDAMPPAEQPETMEQDATSSTGQASTANDNAAMGTTSDPMMNDEPAVADDPAMSDPGLSDDAAASQEPMPSEDVSNVEDPEENPGFGEGTDPMPGADENDDEMNNGQ